MDTKVMVIIGVLLGISILSGGFYLWKHQNKAVDIEEFKQEINKKHAYETQENIKFSTDDNNDISSVPELESEVNSIQKTTVSAPNTNTSNLAVNQFSGLEKSKNSLGKGLLKALSATKLTENTWDDIEELLISADVGLNTSNKIIADLKQKVSKMDNPSYDLLVQALRDSLISELRPEMDRSINIAHTPGVPAVLLMVGVNGVGKTTTTGKIARILTQQGSRVILGAADTFRAAATDQLQTWGKQTGTSVVIGEPNADPASVAYKAVAEGINTSADVVIIDTAGRLHTKTGLMDELGKVERVIEKQAQIKEVLLVLDATVGQNGLQQAKVFSEVVKITGIVLTKLDGTAKGGIVYKIQQDLGVPIKLVGLGEGKDQLAPFNPEAFVNTLLGEN